MRRSSDPSWLQMAFIMRRSGHFGERLKIQLIDPIPAYFP
jgi:hypothetical protein